MLQGVVEEHCEDLKSSIVLESNISVCRFATLRVAWLCSRCICSSPGWGSLTLATSVSDLKAT